MFTCFGEHIFLMAWPVFSGNGTKPQHIEPVKIVHPYPCLFISKPSNKRTEKKFLDFSPHFSISSLVLEGWLAGEQFSSKTLLALSPSHWYFLL